MTDERPPALAEALDGNWFSLGFLLGFLSARLDEDEATARKAQTHYQHVLGIPHYFPANSDTSVAMSPRVALAEVAAKRAIVLEAAMVIHPEPPRVAAPDYWRGQRAAGVRTLRLLALPYDEHRDFRQEWRL
jgi:hypothetical protein